MFPSRRSRRGLLPLLLALVSSAIVVCVVCVYNEHATYVRRYPTVGSDDKVTTVSTKVTVPCDVECRRFQRLMAQWPSTKPKAAIVYLASRLNFLLHSITSVDEFFCREFNYPVVIFHEAWMFKKQGDRNAVLRAAAWNSSLVFFQKVEFKIPTFLPKPVLRDIPCFSGIGYRHMCRFQAKGRILST